MLQQLKKLHLKSILFSFLAATIILSLIFFLIYFNLEKNPEECVPEKFYPEYEKCLDNSVVPTNIGTIEPTPTMIPFPYQAIDSIKTFTRNELLTQDRGKAIENITKAMLNLQKVNSIGFSILSNDGDEVKYSYDAEIMKDFPNMTLKYKVENIKYVTIGGDFEVDNMRGSGVVAGSYADNEQMDQGFFEFVFYPDHIRLNDCCYERRTITHLREDLSLNLFKATQMDMGNGIWGVEYLFENPEDFNSYGHYLIRIGEDGLIYGIHYPNVYAYDEYSKFEYNQEYNIDVSLGWDSSFSDYLIPYTK